MATNDDIRVCNGIQDINIRGYNFIRNLSFIVGIIFYIICYTVYTRKLERINKIKRGYQRNLPGSKTNQEFQILLQL